MMEEWDGTERRRSFCEGHIKLCEDISYIKATLDAISKRINGSIDDMKIHINHGAKWRITIAGVALSLAISIIGAALVFGQMKTQIEDNSSEIKILRGAK